MAAMIDEARAPSAGGAGPALLRVRELVIHYATDRAVVPATDAVTFEISPGERVGLVGESGSGKTATLLGILGLLPPAGRVVAGSIEWRGENITRAPADRLRSLRGAEIGAVFQDPSSSLHPSHRVDRQVAEAVLAHRPALGKDAALERARDLLESMGVGSEAAGRYPHELSGGMKQRVGVAIAIVNRPALLLADEPTTALDVTVQARVLGLIETARRDTGAALVLVSHDLALVADTVDRVLVMAQGRIVEEGRVEEVLRSPRDPLTARLLAARPGAGDPSLRHGDHHAQGCMCSCGPVRIRGREPARPGPAGPGQPAGAAEDGAGLLRVRDLTVHYRTPRLFRPDRVVRAVDGVSFELDRRETLALVGESGCGKSTLARALLRLEPVTAGSISLDGRELTTMDSHSLRATRREIQIVFQHPLSSLNPRRTVAAQVAQPLRNYGELDSRDRRRRVLELLEMVRLGPRYADRLPSQLSGGEQQRVGIARALALGPRVLVLDEPVSSLDVTVQAELLALLVSLQARLGLACLFISHDLSVVRRVAQRVAVMRAGRIVETGSRDAIYGSPRHPYTRELLAASPGA